MGGDTHQYYPDLVYDNHQVEPPRTPEQGYHLTEDLVDHAIEFIADSKQVAPDKPFFMYFCPGAMHAPHHVPTRVGRQVQGPVRRRLGRLPRQGVRAAAEAGRAAAGHAAVRARSRRAPRGTAWTPTRSASTRA